MHVQHPDRSQIAILGRVEPEHRVVALADVVEANRQDLIRVMGVISALLPTISSRAFSMSIACVDASGGGIKSATREGFNG